MLLLLLKIRDKVNVGKLLECLCFVLVEVISGFELDDGRGATSGGWVGALGCGSLAFMSETEKSVLYFCSVC